MRGVTDESSSPALFLSLTTLQNKPLITQSICAMSGLLIFINSQKGKRQISKM